MEDMILKRVSVVALILAIFFGILQHIPSDKTYNLFTLEMGLKVIATTFFNIVLLLFLIYFVLVSINLGYGMKNIVPEFFLKIFYNVSVLSTLIIIFWVLGFGLLINLVPPLTVQMGAYLFLAILFFGAIVFVILMERYLKK